MLTLEIIQMIPGTREVSAKCLADFSDNPSINAATSVWLTIPEASLVARALARGTDCWDESDVAAELGAQIAPGVVQGENGIYAAPPIEPLPTDPI